PAGLTMSSLDLLLSSPPLSSLERHMPALATLVSTHLRSSAVLLARVANPGTNASWAHRAVPALPRLILERQAAAADVAAPVAAARLAAAAAAAMLFRLAGGGGGSNASNNLNSGGGGGGACGDVEEGRGVGVGVGVGVGGGGGPGG